MGTCTDNIIFSGAFYAFILLTCNGGGTTLGEAAGEEVEEEEAERKQSGNPFAKSYLKIRIPVKKYRE